MKKFVACALTSLALLASESALAQASAAASAAAAAPVSAEAEKAARELLASMKFREMSTNSVRQMLQGLPMALMQSTGMQVGKNAKLNDEQKKAAMGKAEKDAAAAASKISDSVVNDNKLWNELEKETAQVFARHFQVDEMRQLATFYKSPIGIKALQTVPSAMGEASMVAQKALMPKINQQIEKFATDHAK